MQIESQKAIVVIPAKDESQRVGPVVKDVLKYPNIEEAYNKIKDKLATDYEKINQIDI